MRIAYFDCASGISGDMTLGALIDGGASLNRIRDGLHSLGLPDLTLAVAPVKKCGFRALQIRVDHPPESKHRHLHHIDAMIDGSDLTLGAKGVAKSIFHAIGQAEAKVHGCELKKVHFHEVGAIDSIADVVGVAIALDELGIERVEASPVPTGKGFVEIAHGRVSIPAPATAELLCGIPLAPSDVEFELTTPTGAGILKATSRRFGSVPPMTIQAIGYGSGNKDLPGQPNVLRVLLGELSTAAPVPLLESDRIWILETNIDDQPAAEIAHAIDRLWLAGAVDVYQVPCLMKKGRSGICLTVLCGESRVLELETILFDAGLTLGIRRWSSERHKLIRRTHQVETPFGPIQGKIAWLPRGVWRFSAESDVLRDVASVNTVTAREVQLAAQSAFSPPPAP